MTKIFIGTSNKGKQQEIARYAEYSNSTDELLFPDKSTEIKVNESGATFEENALLKAMAYQKAFGSTASLFVGDDSGLIIPALNNEPGVFTRRWAGHEMTDPEIIEYCLTKMKHLRGDERVAILESVVAIVEEDKPPRYLHGQMYGRIVEEPMNVDPVEGFPFRSLFWVDGINKPISELHSLKPEDRRNFLTHREQAFKNLFDAISDAE